MSTVLSRLRPQRGPRVIERGRALRIVGLVAIYGVIAIIAVNGIIRILDTGATDPAAGGTPTAASANSDAAVQAAAVRYAAAWLTIDPGALEQRSRTLASMMTPSAANTGAHRIDKATRAQQVTSLSVAGTAALDEHHTLVTVAAGVQRGSVAGVRYLVVPVTHDGDAIAVHAAPAFTAAPALTESADTAQPLTGDDQAPIAELINQFAPAYLGGGGPEDVAFYAAPGADLRPVAPALRDVSVTGLDDMGVQADGSRLVRATVRATDPGIGAQITLALTLTTQLDLAANRWQVAAVNSAPPVNAG